jgi:hypothetical protein
MRNVRGIRSDRLDHLGIVAGVCREIGLAEYLDALAEPSQQQVGVGTATVAMILERARVQQPSPVSGRAVLCDQAGRTPVGSRHHGRDAA